MQTIWLVTWTWHLHISTYIYNYINICSTCRVSFESFPTSQSWVNLAQGKCRHVYSSSWRKILWIYMIYTDVFFYHYIYLILSRLSMICIYIYTYYPAKHELSVSRCDSFWLIDISWAMKSPAWVEHHVPSLSLRLKLRYPKTRRRMARERRGAESSVVSMETLYYKIIW